MSHPLGLSDVQLRLVLDAAKSISPDWRSRFLEGVVDQLLGIEGLTNEDVSEAVSQVKQRMHLRIKGKAA